MLWNWCFFFATVICSEVQSFSISIQLDVDSSSEELITSIDRKLEIVDKCTKYEMPNFSELQLRVSERKCMENIWRMVKREERKNLGCSSDADLTIVNGNISQIAEFSHMAALMWQRPNGNYECRCGGTVISRYFVLTAAHCTLESDKPKFVRLDTRYLVNSPYELPLDVNIVQWIKHPKYKEDSKYNDIGLLGLERSLYFSKFLQPACLSNNDNYKRITKEFTVSGWGAMNDVGQASNELRYATVDVLPPQICNRTENNRHWNGIVNQLCAGAMDGSADTCQGDSGGPLQYEVFKSISEGTIYRVIGVTSFGLGEKCALEKKPAVYTDVSKYIDWIEKNVWPNGF